MSDVDGVSPIGRNIAHARRLAGLSIRRLAQLTGATSNQISEWEHGKHIPGTASLLRLAAALQRPVGWFHIDHTAQALVDGGMLDDVAVVATDDDFVVTAWNSHARQLLGWTSSEAVGRSWFELVPSLDGMRQNRLLVALELGWWEGCVVFEHKGGDAVALTLTSVSVSDGPLMAWVMILRASM